jgi:uncharacterized protein (DUF4415 family)/uncharacterized DUF497 family protein
LGRLRNARRQPCAPAAFEWDENKSKANFDKHGIDFEDATEIFYGPVLLRKSDRNDEERWIAVGLLETSWSPSFLRGERMSSGSSRRDALGRMKKEHIITRKWGDRRKGKTDWARVDALTDEDIAKAVASDPDAAPVDIDWSDAVLVIPAKKKAISIRLDEDVLDFFKREGEGYQRRINAVLRSYMQQKVKPKKRA